jgi:hypothetical protein
MLNVRLVLVFTLLAATGCLWLSDDDFPIHDHSGHHSHHHGPRDASAVHDAAEVDASVPTEDGAVEDAEAADACASDSLCLDAASLVWPNAEAPANSSAWLRENHQRVTELRPRVLVIDVVQTANAMPIAQFVASFVAAIEEQTRYHGYSDEAAKPFIRYQIDRILDLKDPAGAEYPESWPVVDSDIGALFTKEFAPTLGYPAPENPNRFMPMCELFERTNGCFNDPQQRVNCKVTVRMQELNKERGVGCAIHAAEHVLENMWRWIPYVHENAHRFFGFDLDTRYGLSVDSLYVCPYYTGNDDCVEHPMPNVLVSGVDFPGAPFRIDNWGAACGSNHFPPNAGFQYDYGSLIPALSSCPSYGLGGNADGSDLRTEYTAALVQQYEQTFPDCGGGWITYLGQSFPGAGNHATDARGQPMLNWWPFLFY